MVPRVSVGQPEQDPDEGCLARAVGPQVAEGAAPRDQQLDTVDRDVLAEPLGEPVGLDGPLVVRIGANFCPVSMVRSSDVRWGSWFQGRTAAPQMECG